MISGPLSTYTKKRWAGLVARMGEKRGAFRTLVGRPEGRRPLRGDSLT
jgi:hypothetical protein